MKMYENKIFKRDAYIKVTRETRGKGGNMEYTASEENNYKMLDISEKDVKNILRYSSDAGNLQKDKNTKNTANVQITGSGKDDLIKFNSVGDVKLEKNEQNKK